MAKVNLVLVPSSDVEEGGFPAKKFVIEIGDKRTLFFVFKSEGISQVALARIHEHLRAKLLPDADTKLVTFVLDPDDDFEIHELET